MESSGYRQARCNRQQRLQILSVVLVKVIFLWSAMAGPEIATAIAATSNDLFSI